MSHRRRAQHRRRMLPGVLLLVAGVLLAAGAPWLWSVTHRDPALATIDPGIAVALADQDPGSSLPASPSASPPAVTSPVPRSAAAAPLTQQEAASPSAGSPATGPRSAAAAARPSSHTSPTPASPSHVAPRTAPSTTPPPTTVPPTTPPSPTTVPSPTTAVKAMGTPTRLVIPAIGVDAPVEAVGVDDRGDMAIPEQVQQIGWYRFGAAPGSAAGSVVMSGHVDSAAQGLGAFADLGRLKAGDKVVVSDAEGRRSTYSVVGKEAFDKTSVPLAKLFSRSGSARLTLITCGGGFDAVAKSYLDNIVVTAVPS